MSTIDVTPIEEQIAKAVPKVPLFVQDAITKILSPSAAVPWNGIPDHNTERVVPMLDEHSWTFATGKTIPGASTVSDVYTYAGNNAQPVLSTLSAVGLNFIIQPDTRWSMAILLEPSLLSHGWFRLEYMGKLLASDPNYQRIVITGPIVTTNPQLTPLFNVRMALHGQNGSGGPSVAINLYTTIKDEPACRAFAARWRLGASSVTITQNVDSFYDGGISKQASWASERRVRNVVGTGLSDSSGAVSTSYNVPYYAWDGTQVDKAYTGGSMLPPFVATQLEGLMSQSKEYTSAPMKDPLTGGVYSICRGDGTWSDAELTCIDAPFCIPFSSVNHDASIKMGNVCSGFQAPKVGTQLIVMSNLHSSCLLEMHFRQASEIVPGLNSPLNSFAIRTPTAPGGQLFFSLLKEMSNEAGRCNPASANDMGTLWRKVRGMFDKHRGLIAGLASRIPEVGLPLAAVIESVPYKQSARDRKVEQDARVDQVTSNLAKVGIKAKRTPAAAPVKKKKPLKVSIQSARRATVGGRKRV